MSTNRVIDHIDLVGGLVWVVAGGAVLAGRLSIDLISELLLFGPLVVVPLGLPLLHAHSDRDHPDDQFGQFGRIGQFGPVGRTAAATALVVAFALPRSTESAALTLPWLAATLVLAAGAVEQWPRLRNRSVPADLVVIAQLWLPLAAVHITLARAGVTYAGIRPTLIELAGVHFTFAGFGATTLAACLVAASTGRRRLVAEMAAAALVGGSALVAVGHVTIRAVELVGTIGVTGGVVTMAGLGWYAFDADTIARVLLRISSLAVLAPMGFALAYSWALTTGSHHLTYDTIAAIHGSLNAVGFVTCGMVAWRVGPRLRSRRSLGRLALDAWGLTILGGAMCGLVSDGLITVVLFPFSLAIGALLGLVIGAPLALVITVVVARGRSPWARPERFERTLSITGMVIALAATSPLLVADGATVVGSAGLLDPIHGTPSLAGGLAYTANAVLAVVGVAAVGWCFGRHLARAHLRRGSRHLVAPPTSAAVGS